MNQTRTKDQVFLIVFAISILLFGLDHQQILNTPKDLINQIATPLQIPFVFARKKIEQLSLNIKSIPTQQRQVKDLERRLLELSLKANKADEYEKELSLLKNNSKIESAKGYTVLTAKVISLTRFAIINRGAKDGIRPGLAVIIDDSLVGIVKSVLDHRSLVQLLKDPQTELDVISLGGTVGKLRYQDNALVAQEVLQKNQLNKEEPVFTKGSQEIPDGLLVGYINKIEEKPSSVYKHAHIDQAHEIFDQSQVIVALN